MPPHSRLLRVSTVALAAAACLCLAPRSARAEVALAADLELDAPIDTDLDVTPGFGARLGWQMHVPLIVLTPELGYHHVGFDGVSVDRFIAGARIGIGEVFRVGAYGHVGVGHVGFDSVQGEDATDLTIDLGGFLDFTLLPLLDLGVHAGYARVRADEGDGLRWVPVGVHVALIF